MGGEENKLFFKGELAIRFVGRQVNKHACINSHSFV